MKKMGVAETRKDNVASIENAVITSQIMQAIYDFPDKGRGLVL